MSGIGNEYIELLQSGIYEAEIKRKYKIKSEELYATVAYSNQQLARKLLKHFCLGCANDLCFCWPLREETPCPVRGYEPHCPLKK